MVGLNPATGESLEKSTMPSNVNTQIDADRLVQPVVCRGQPSDDGRGRRPVDSDLRECQVDSFSPRRLQMHKPHDPFAIHEQTRRLRAPGDPQHSSSRSITITAVVGSFTAGDSAWLATSTSWRIPYNGSNAVGTTQNRSRTHSWTSTTRNPVFDSAVARLHDAVGMTDLPR